MSPATDRTTDAEFAPGSVALVGGGPGAADLLTVRAMRLLRQADVAQALDAQAEAWHRVEEAYGQWAALRQHVAEGLVFYETLHDRLRRLADV